jgi:hypothetical protein
VTSWEYEIFKVAVKYAKKYQQANPEVGMGDTDGMIIAQVEKESGAQVRADERVTLTRYLEKV